MLESHYALYACHAVKFTAWRPEPEQEPELICLDLID